MRRSPFPATLALLALLTQSCTKPPSKIDHTTALTVRRPAELLVKQVISGPILGMQMKNPSGLAADDQGALYVCDAGNNRILKFGSDLTPVRESGGFGSEPGLFGQPRFVTVDNRLNLWVTDPGSRRVVRLDANLKYVDEVNLHDEQDALKYGAPTGVASSIYGVLWIADREKSRVATFDNVGRFDRFVGDFGYSGGQLLHPEKIITGPDDEYVVCDAGNRRIVFYDSYGNFTRTLENPRFEFPVAVTDDRAGNLWILDQKLGILSLYDQQRRFVLERGPQLNGNSTALRAPSDIAVMSDGRIVIADSGNNRLVVCETISAAP